MLAFKIMDDPFVGTITFCRIYSGRLESGTGVHQLHQGPQGAHRPHAADARQQSRGHQGSLCRRHRRARRPQGGAHRRHAVRSAEDGDPREDGIPRSGDRDRDRAEVEGRPGEARRRARQARGRGSVVPRRRPIQESGQTILKGMGELHLDIKVDILKRTYKVDANIGAPQVAYRERITEPVTVDYTHKKQTGGPGQFARVKIVGRAAASRRRASSSRTTSSAARCRRNTSRRSRRASNRCSAPACSRASRWSTSRCTLDRRRLPRRRLVGAHLRDRGARGVARGAAEGRRRCCSSRS